MLPTNTNRDLILHYARAAGWDSERLLELIFDWLDQDPEDGWTLEGYLLSKFTDEQIDRTCEELLG